MIVELERKWVSRPFGVRVVPSYFADMNTSFASTFLIPTVDPFSFPHSIASYFILLMAFWFSVYWMLISPCSHHAITWECDNGGQLWNATADATAPATSSGATLPTAFCATGFSSLNIAFICGLVVDIVCQARVLLPSADPR
jgi:hypothetical protein